MQNLTNISDVGFGSPGQSFWKTHVIVLLRDKRQRLSSIVVLRDRSSARQAVVLEDGHQCASSPSMLETMPSGHSDSFQRSECDLLSSPASSPCHCTSSITSQPPGAGLSVARMGLASSSSPKKKSSKLAQVEKVSG